MILGVSSYSFQRYLDDGSMSLLDVVDQATAMGFLCIEFAGLGKSIDDPEIFPLAKELRQRCDDYQLPIANYAISADFLRAENGLEAEVERVKEEVKIAAALGCHMMRHDITAGPPDNDLSDVAFNLAQPVLAHACRAITEFAARLGIVTMVENHGFFIQHPNRCARLVRSVNHPNFRALIDIGNFLCVDESPVQSVQTIAPYIAHCHVKDFHQADVLPNNGHADWFRTAGGRYLRGAILGEGVVDVTGCLRQIKRAGYNGPIVIEFEGAEDNIPAISRSLENLRSCLREL